MLTPDDILDGLNPPQREAVIHNTGPMLVLAGAGSGKTRVITRKIAWLVSQEGLAPWQILAVTFTNKAAAEMRERCHQLLGAPAEDLWLGTFHRIGVRILRQHGELVGIPQRFVIYDQDDQRAMLNRCVKELGYAKDAVDPKMIQGFIDRAKQRGHGPAEDAADSRRMREDAIFKVYSRYEQRMREAGAVDFGDLLMLPLRILRQHPLVASEYKSRWRYILVDEFQDTNQVQYDFLKAVLGDERNICVVGDDDQSIYRWRGAEVANILGFDQEVEGARVIRLEQNYRSSQNILDVAGAIIALNSERHGKTLWTERGPGEPVRLHRAPTDLAEADYVVRRIATLRGRYTLGEMAIFYRTHAQSRVFEDALRRTGTPYIVVGGLRFYERAEVKDLVAYLRVLANPLDTIAFERIINTPARGIGKTTVELIRTRSLDRELSFWEACKSFAAEGTPGQRKKLQPFVSLIEELTALAEEAPGAVVARRVLELTRMIEVFKARGDATDDARIDNLKELVSAIDEHATRTGEESLSGFLENVALESAVDRSDFSGESVVMMSAHNAKGLEYDVVFLTGLEDGLFPHFNSRQEEGGIEEERRLAYVACTRARHVLHMSYADLRRRFGQTVESIPSPFLSELPEDAIEMDTQGVRAIPFHQGFRPPPRRQKAQEPQPSYSQAMPDYEDFSQEEVRLGPGAPVFHPTFGEGRIVELTGSDRQAVARVRFSGGTEKRILARFLTPG